MSAGTEAFRYRSVMTFVDLRKEAAAAVHLAATVARMFDARLLGIGACPIVPETSFGQMAGLGYELVEIARRQALSRLSQAEALFRCECGLPDNVSWFQDMVLAANFVAERSRCADLIVVQGLAQDGEIDIGDLLLKAGRPVLVAAPGAQMVSTSNVVVAWKDTKEARRAVLDALPFLHRAKRVVLAEITDGEGTASDVQAYLGLCGIDAEIRQEAPNMDSTADQLVQITRQIGAELMVCGGYGHSRAGEWIFGGVTRNLLRDCRVSCLMSH